MCQIALCEREPEPARRCLRAYEVLGLPSREAGGCSGDSIRAQAGDRRGDAQTGRITSPFAHDLLFTFVMLFYSLVAVGLVWAVIFDQRYRCRSCLRRLRMPIHRVPGTTFFWALPARNTFACSDMARLTVAELQITGHAESGLGAEPGHLDRAVYP